MPINVFQMAVGARRGDTDRGEVRARFAQGPLRQKWGQWRTSEILNCVARSVSAGRLLPVRKVR